MKRLFYRILLSAFPLAAIVTGSQAANGYIDTLHYTMCPGDTLTLETPHRVEVTRDCIIFDTILVAEPTMDSIHMYVVNLYPAYRFVQRKEIIPGQTFNWCGETIQEAGTYTKVYKSQHGCDSTQILVVTQREGMEMELRSQQVIPFCDSVAWNGIIYRESAVLTDTLLSTVYGCDSIVTTILTKGIPFRHYETDSLFIGETLSWHGLTINEAGEYYDEHTNHFGCDSTYVLRVVLKASAPQPKVSSTRMTICEGDAFPWRGESHTLSGTYYDTVFNGSEIDTLHVLYLTVLHPTNITSATVQDICADARTFDITFTYTGAQPTAYSIYFDQLAKDEGFKDVINQQLYGETRIASAPLPEKPEVVYLEHTKYVKPNTYTMSLVLDNGICGKSSVDSIAIKIKYPNWIIEQNWNDIVVPLKQELNGGYEFSQVDWYVNEVRQINNGKGYLQYNFRDGDQVVMSATRKGENYAIETCPLTIHINSNIAYDEPVLVYPTQTPRYMPKVTVESPRDGQYEIFNSTGLIINSGELHEGQTDLMLPGTCGIYFIRVLQGDQVSSHKVLVY